MRDLRDLPVKSLVMTIDGTEGPDVFNGGSGPDTYSGLGGRDTIRGGEGNDLLSGGADDDNIDGQGGDDTVQGDGGNDVLVGGSGNDLIDGGAGDFDLASYGGAVSGVTVDLRITGPQAVGGGLGIDTLVNVERLSGSFFTDTLIGNEGHNGFTGGQGDDRIDGQGRRRQQQQLLRPDGRRRHRWRGGDRLYRAERRHQRRQR